MGDAGDSRVLASHKNYFAIATRIEGRITTIPLLLHTNFIVAAHCLSPILAHKNPIVAHTCVCYPCTTPFGIVHVNEIVILGIRCATVGSWCA
jgi:hypothetical protein